MKQLAFLTAVLLTACNKPITAPNPTPIDAYYKVVAVDRDGKFLESETVHLKTATAKNEDDDHDHHGGCGPLPVTFKYITAVLTTLHTVEIIWEIEDELNVLQYEVQQSISPESWQTVRTVLSDSSKRYTVIIKI